VLNVKVFDYQLDIDGVEAMTHTLATGPVNDLELALFPDEQGGLSWRSSPISSATMKRR
jgi:enterobactin synthetase component F